MEKRELIAMRAPCGNKAKKWLGIKTVCLALCLLPLLPGCSSGSKAMSKDSFAMIDIGAPISDVVAQYGEPYSIRSRGGGCDIYEYIERIRMDYLVIQQRRYYLVVTDGRVVGKYVKLTNPPAYEQIYDDELYPVY